MNTTSPLIEWYSGHTLYERPLRLFWRGHRLEVITVLDRGYYPDGAFFKILASDHTIYLMKFQRSRDTWHIEAPA